MSKLKGDYVDLIRFIPAGKEKTSIENDKSAELKTALSGTEAKEFYERLILNENGEKFGIESKAFTKHERRKKKHSVKKSSEDGKTRTETCKGDITFNANDFLKFAQHGKLGEVQKLLDRGIPVDVCDTFGWTAVMCAAYEGHEDVVSLLLSHGANVDIFDGQHKTASSLARDRGHKNILDLIDKYRMQQSHNNSSVDLLYNSSHDHSSDNLSHNSKCHVHSSDNLSHNSKCHISFFCDICKSEFKDCSKKNHETSTLHLFNSKLKPKPDSYLIPATNVGYQLMRKSGWDGEKGLGSSGQGQKYPVKTVLKRDRKCLGDDSNPKKKGKITHFGPNDTSSVKRTFQTINRKLSARTLSKKAKLAQDRKQKKWEQNYRMSFNCE